MSKPFVQNDKLSERLKKKIGLAGYVKRELSETEALPRGFDIFNAPVFKPEKFEPARPGANDFLKIKSICMNETNQ